jgi:D-xylose transport system ATP-binding protein
MVGREIKDLFPRRTSEKGPALLAVNDLTVANEDNDKLLLQNIGFELRAGEVLGLGGLMGAGRTELLMHIFGGYGKRVSGKIYIDEKEYSGHLPFESIRRGLVLVSEDRKRYGLLLSKSVGFNLSLSALKQFLRKGFINRNAEIRSNEKYIHALGIRTRGQETSVQTLSGGNQQKVVLGKVLMTLPKVVFLDEPTRGIDVGAKVEVYEIINQLTQEGKAVVLVSSELPELLGMSDRIIILSSGKIGGVFNRNEATQEAILNAAMKYQ